MESPNTMLFELQDIVNVVAIAKRYSITTILENTYSTPLYQHPIAMGVDIVVHTATKYLSGHSDVVAGVVCSSSSRIQQLFHHELLTLGTIISPTDAWLFIRGLRTLEVRMERISSSAKKVIHFLENHAAIEQVIYPFSPLNPQLKLAKKQMSGMGGLFSVLLKTKEVSKIESFCNALKIFSIAVSWGGYESLVFPVCASYYSTDHYTGALPINLVRLYVALEDPQLLIDDLSSALEML
jgi:cystathionine beta-lyase/cystathionine gamma-synthase